MELIAPSVFLLSPKFTNPEPGALPDHHFTVFLAGGDGARFRQGTDRWAYSENVEVLVHGIYGEVRIENFYTPDHVQFQTVRTGYLAHPKPPLLGGVTIGYRAAHGDQSQNALEVGLPARLGSETGAIRFEPTYLFSGAGVSWNYRLLFEFYIARARLVTGADFEAKPLRQGGPYFGTLALVLGTRF